MSHCFLLWKRQASSPSIIMSRSGKDSKFINDTDSGIDGVLDKFAGDNKLGGAVDYLKGTEALQTPQQIREMGHHQLYEV